MRCGPAQRRRRAPHRRTHRQQERASNPLHQRGRGGRGWGKCCRSEALRSASQFADGRADFADCADQRLFALMPPAPVGGAGDPGLLQGAGHGDGRLLGHLFQLGNFGGDLHGPIMCTHAQLSTETVCVLAQCEPGHFGALRLLMGTQPKSKAVEAYRAQIAQYLTAVQLHTGWKLVRMGEAAGGVKHTTISRALKGDHTMNFPALLALQDASGVPIPESLTQAAAGAARQPTQTPAPTADDLRRLVREFEERSPDQQRALINELRRALTKAG